MTKNVEVVPWTKSYGAEAPLKARGLQEEISSRANEGPRYPIGIRQDRNSTDLYGCSNCLALNLAPRLQQQGIAAQVMQLKRSLQKLLQPMLDLRGAKTTAHLIDSCMQRQASLIGGPLCM